MYTLNGLQSQPAGQTLSSFEEDKGEGKVKEEALLLQVGITVMTSASPDVLLSVAPIKPSSSIFEGMTTKVKYAARTCLFTEDEGRHTPLSLSLSEHSNVGDAVDIIPTPAVSWEWPPTGDANTVKAVFV